MICSKIVAFSLAVDSINFGKSIASSSTKLLSNCWPPFCPFGSITFKLEFLPLRSTIRPLFIVMCRLGGVTDPSRLGLDGLCLLPPRAHAIASSTLVFPWLLFPPMIVNPFWLGSITAALTRLTFSISSRLILVVIIDHHTFLNITCQIHNFWW